MASTTSNAVWGALGSAPQTHEEPISGATGNVSKGEPYDAGNMGGYYFSPSERDLRDGTGPRDRRPHTVPVRDDAPTRLTSETDPEDQNKLESAMETGADENTPGKQPNSAADVQASDDTELPSAPPAPAAPPHPPAAAAAAPTPPPPPHPPAAAPTPSTIEDNERHNANKDKAAFGESLEHRDSVANATEDIPQPNETVPPSSSSEGTKESTQAGQVEKEQYFKATGLAADGGDFDAARPGAGREADRLMEEKGMHIDKGGAGGHGGGKDKPSLGDRIKNKLHKH